MRDARATRCDVLLSIPVGNKRNEPPALARCFLFS